MLRTFLSYLGYSSIFEPKNKAMIFKATFASFFFLGNLFHFLVHFITWWSRLCQNAPSVHFMLGTHIHF